MPSRSKDILAEALQQKRLKFNAPRHTINWKELHKERNKNRNLVATEWLQILCRGMRTKPFSYIHDGEAFCFDEDLGLKIATVTIDSLDSFSDDFWLHFPRDETKTRKKYETLLRMGVKGCLHYCFNPVFTHYDKVKVVGFYTDFCPFGSIKLDEKRILDRLNYETRDYVEIKPGIEIVQVEKSADSKTPEVNFEELTDLTLGTTRYICSPQKRKEWKDEIAMPLRKLYKKKEIRKSNFRHSSHHRSFSLGVCKTDEKGDISFKDREISEEVSKKEPLTLFS